MGKIAFVYMSLMLFVVVFAAKVLYSDSCNAKTELGRANERSAMLNERIERIVSVLPVEVPFDKETAAVGNNVAFEALMVSIRKMVSSCAEAEREVGELDARIIDIAGNSSMQVAYLRLTEICEGNPQAQKVLRVHNCDSEEFHRCLKVVHGVYMYNYDTDKCGEALDERASCLKKGGMTKYPTIIPSGT